MSRIAQSTNPKCLCHDFGLSDATLFIKFFNVPTNLSHRPVYCGRPGTLKLGLRPKIFKNVVVKLLVKLLAQSDLIVDGMPTSWKTCNKALHTLFAVSERNGTANVYLVLLSHKTSA